MEERSDGFSSFLLVATYIFFIIYSSSPGITSHSEHRLTSSIFDIDSDNRNLNKYFTNDYYDALYIMMHYNLFVQYYAESITFVCRITLIVWKSSVSCSRKSSRRTRSVQSSLISNLSATFEIRRTTSTSSQN